jgi:hypothetical protein
MNTPQDILKQKIARLQKKKDRQENIVKKLSSLDFLDQLERTELQSYKEPIENIIKKAENIIDMNEPFIYKTTNNSYNIDLEENSKEIINEIIEKCNENMNYLQDNNYNLQHNNYNLQQNNDNLQQSNDNLQKKIKIQKIKIKQGKQKQNNNFSCNNIIIVILLIFNVYLYNKTYGINII